MTLRLHDYLPSGNGYKVRLLLTQLNIPFERIEYDIDRGETRTPAFLENVNANGRVPALETEEGEFLPESNAILFYLSGGTPLLPDDRLGRARAAVDVLRAVQPRAEHSRGTRLASRLRHGDDGKTPDRPRGETKARVRRA